MYRRNYYRFDPRWIQARYPGRCHCGREIRPGDRAFYYPKGKELQCEDCGRIGEAELIDDDMNQILHIR